ncbi:molybdopterin-binding protein [Aureimonas leprariae]|uniref:molybdopterin-binding protein n=1 Tax=Plantimonas leprariae TaxID=2615207 RepID=UPI0031B5F37C
MDRGTHRPRYSRIDAGGDRRRDPRLGDPCFPSAGSAAGVKFGLVSLDEAEGAILAHAANLPEGRIAKGMRLGPDDLHRLGEAGRTSVIAARLDADDLPENEAAARLGTVLTSNFVRADDAATGRVNLFAERNGVFVVDRALVDCLNAVDSGITLATLAEHAPVIAGQMVATVKIIPLAVPNAAVEAAREIAAASAVFEVAPYRPHRVALVQTRLPSIKEGTLDKTRRVLEARLAVSDSSVVQELRCDHDADALAAALRELHPADLVVIFGASAVIDVADVVPAAIGIAGGTVSHLGMPVDPGNLLLLGRFRDAPILGAPGCARSPKENGFDWVLNRLLADVPVLPEDLRRMGVGGLLMEIPSRPQPRQER